MRLSRTHRLLGLTGLLFAVLCRPVLAADAAKQIFDQAAGSIYQVLIIELESDSKSSLGSGFAVNASGLVATNFHVVANAVHDPDKYRVELLDAAGEQRVAAVVDFDVIHDLALVRFQEGQPTQPLSIAAEALTKGQDVFSLGNPYDLGQTIVPGTFNGLLEKSFYQKLLLSGSLNPGMSGGPSLNNAGEVIGVNVASSGNQISFLVPVKYLNALIGRERTLEGNSFKTEIREQLYADQDYKYQLLLEQDWQSQELGEVLVGADISEYFKCWGDTQDDDDRLYVATQSSCTSQDDIFISSRFQTGAIDYQYGWVESDALNNLRFQSLMGGIYGRMYTRNRATEDDVSNYQCKTWFVDARDEADAQGVDMGQWRTVLCTRQYLEYEGLYDVLYLGNLMGRPQRGLSSHFALSGVSMDNALKFMARFIDVQRWQSEHDAAEAQELAWDS